MRRHTIQYGETTIEYELLFSRRKSLAITVHPDGRVVVRAPRGVSTTEAATVVQQKGAWIVKQQQMFADLPPPLPPRHYVSGEQQLFLGRSYPLHVVQDRRQGVALVDGRFWLCVRDAHDVTRKEKLMREWYRSQARVIFTERLDACLDSVAHLDLPTPELKIRLMKRRWGSCSSNGTVLLNLRLIQMPPEYIDYVIFHELAHLKEHNHSKAFYALLTQMLPDWQARRAALHKLRVA